MGRVIRRAMRHGHRLAERFSFANRVRGLHDGDQISAVFAHRCREHREAPMMQADDLIESLRQFDLATPLLACLDVIHAQSESFRFGRREYFSRAIASASR